MSYVNVGAWVDGKRPKTKKALKEALASSPADTVFDPTSTFDQQLSNLDGTKIPAGVRLQVTGPCPFTSRKWYATVEMLNGKVRIT